MKIEKTDRKIILDAWRQEFPQFFKGSKTSLLRLNGFALVSIDLHLESATTYYQARVSVHLFHHDDVSTRFYDKEREYQYSLGQHGHKVRVFGEREEFAALCSRIRAETAAKDDLTIHELLSYLQSQPKNAVFRPFFNLEAICVANFFLEGIDFAVQRLEAESHNFSLWPEATRAMLGGSWQIWRDKVIKCLNKEKIEENKRNFLQNAHLYGKIKDYGL